VSDAVVLAPRTNETDTGGRPSPREGDAVLARRANETDTGATGDAAGSSQRDTRAVVARRPPSARPRANETDTGPLSRRSEADEVDAKCSSAEAPLASAAGVQAFVRDRDVRGPGTASVASTRSVRRSRGLSPSLERATPSSRGARTRRTLPLERATPSSRGARTRWTLPLERATPSSRGARTRRTRARPGTPPVRRSATREPTSRDDVRLIRLPLTGVEGERGLARGLLRVTLRARVDVV
jgi:hypothetical protein